jgi:hypothetical protein
MRLLALVSFVLVSACAETVVTDYNGDSVLIQSSSRSVTEEAFSEARRICGTRGLQAEYASTRATANQFVYRHLFLCLTHTKPNYGMPSGSMRRVNYLETTSTL